MIVDEGGVSGRVPVLHRAFRPPAMLPPGESEIPFDFLFGMGNISPDKLCPRL